jgi:hypothetical protein
MAFSQQVCGIDPPLRGGVEGEDVGGVFDAEFAGDELFDGGRGDGGGDEV